MMAKRLFGLHEQVFRDQQSLGALCEGIRVIDRRAEIARCALAYWMEKAW